MREPETLEERMKRIEKQKKKKESDELTERIRTCPCVSCANFRIKYARQMRGEGIIKEEDDE